MTSASTPAKQPGYHDLPVRIAVQLQPQHASYAQIRETASELDELGVDVLMNWDHFFPLSGDPDGAHFECWTMLAAWAESTSHAEIGALVTCNSYRNPQLLADMARTVDHISGGRLILGLGSGWAERDYHEYDYPYGTPGSRLDDLARDLPLIERRFAQLNPPPTRHIPVLIGGGGEKKTLKIVAQHADIWHGFGDATVITRKQQVLDSWCATVGREPADIERSGAVPMEFDGADSIETAVRNEAEALHAVGVRLFTGSVTPPYDLRLVRALLGWRDELLAS